VSCTRWGRERDVYHSRVQNEPAAELAAESRNPDSSFTPSMRLSTALQVSDIAASQVIHPFESAYARMRHVQVLVPFMTHDDSNLMCFMGSIKQTLIPVFSTWSIVMILIVMCAMHPSQ